MPVYSSHITDYRGFGIGERIREERHRRRLTLRELAEKVNLSDAKLSNIENAKVSLDLTELARIAAALETPLPSFFPATIVEHHLIKRSHELAAEPPVSRALTGPEPGPTQHHNPVRPVAELFVGKHMEPLLVQIKPLADRDVHFISHDYEEFMFVLEGQVETLHKANGRVVTERLGAGDSMYFRSSMPHCHRSATSQCAETLNVLYSVRGAIDPSDDEIGTSGQRHYRRGVYADAAREASEKIALLRRSRGISLAHLAAAIGVGTRQLAHVESGEAAPDVDLLLRLARRFRRPIEYFFATTLESEPYYFIQRGAEISKVAPRHRRGARPAEEGGSASVFRPLASGLPERGMHPYYVQFAAAPSEEVRPHEHSGEEFIFVLNGEIEVVLYSSGAERVELLHAGDALFLDSSVRHLIRGRSRNPLAETSADVIDVFWSPVGEEYLFG